MQLYSTDFDGNQTPPLDSAGFCMYIGVSIFLARPQPGVNPARSHHSFNQLTCGAVL